MALQRYKEAEQLLRPHFVAEALDVTDEWWPSHSLAHCYAVCLLNLGHVHDSIAILQKLNAINDRPAEFYINYSLALLKAGKCEVANEVCEHGLLHFPEDLDILGNRTIALKNSGRLAAAQEAAGVL